MKYEVGDKTLLGEIDKSEENSRYSYRVENKWWLTESDVDAIIIKPKRNIDHIIELLEDGKEEAARKFYNDLVPLSEGYAVADEIYYFLKPYTEPIKLTAEERKALELAKMCGFTGVYRVEFITAHTGVVFVVETPGKSFECLVSNVPAWSFLQDAKWITTDDRLTIDELLKGGAE